ncbi:transmembrane reductase CYB561D2-like [Leguminivora glycinivorella]|uniref:transmembrane reductase CYB561D2-like n=1 Tax=Leguminivora glycinivorella TaxID=1035111 RepID=UPI00200C19B4|nr:transmembrane reductase CYB561D2-like [Leguminivora glycinivorella]
MGPQSEERSGFITCMNVVNSITHWVLGAVAILAITFNSMFAGSAHFTQHVYLCVIGYVVLMAQGILTFSPHTGWTRSMRYQDKKVIHWVMQVAGSILAVTGSIIRIVNVSNNFQTPHGILGLIAMIFTVLSLIGGVIGLFSKTAAIKIGHSFAGSVTLIAAFICLCLGFDKTVVRLHLNDTIANLAIAFTVIGLVGTLCSAAMSNFNRIVLR